jgi:hypothetical protein
MNGDSTSKIASLEVLLTSGNSTRSSIHHAIFLSCITLFPGRFFLVLLALPFPGNKKKGKMGTNHVSKHDFIVHFCLAGWQPHGVASVDLLALIYR